MTNAEKSAAYKKLVADMQKKYPVYGGKIDVKVNQKGNPIAREIVKKFAATFQSKQDFYDALKEFGLTWKENSKNNEAIYEMRAKEALRLAIEDGFDPFNFVTKKDPPVELFAPVVNGENICHEINLYTYWQGFGYAKKTPKIKYLLVAQDWGNLFRADDKYFQELKIMNETGKWISYDTVPQGNGTNNNLFRLFEVLNRDLLKLNDDLFFTNFCLGYRSGKEVGGMTKELMMNDSKEFKKLCEILEPENILCLGQLTSECVYESLIGKNFADIYKGSKNYNDFLENHKEIFAQCGNVESKIFPLAHCGYMGTMNRNRNLPKQDDKLFYQKQDWKKILESDEKTGGVKMKKTALYGAIFGDIIGMPFEFDHKVNGVKKSKKFKLFHEEATFTDDSVMTIAVAEALLGVDKNADEKTVCDAVIKSMQRWGKKYPSAGYGSKFRYWLKEDNPKPYNSWGNGSAMRVSAVGWLYDTLERTREVARWTAEVSHNHPEGIKGAESTASAIFLARQGKSKAEIKKYIETEFGYNFNRTLDEIRPTYRHIESCQETVPEACTAFFESTDFEDAVRNGVSLGGDADTLTCIDGAIAEAFYGIPENLIEEGKKYLPSDILKVVDEFNEKIFGKKKL